MESAVSFARLRPTDFVNFTGRGGARPAFRGAGQASLVSVCAWGDLVTIIYSISTSNDLLLILSLILLQRWELFRSILDFGVELILDFSADMLKTSGVLLNMTNWTFS